MAEKSKLTVTGFVNKIDVVPGENDQDDKVFVKIAYSRGNGQKRQTQYMGCYVAKSLHFLFKTAEQTQIKVDEHKYENVLNSQLSDLIIVDPYFEVNDEGFLEGNGILTSLTFKQPELKPTSSNNSAKASAS